MPNRLQTINGSDIGAVVNAVNRNFQVLDGENLTKSFNGPNNTKSIIQGRLPNEKYGQLYYDTDGTARILIGQHPTSDRMGIWVSREGYDILDELSA